MVSSTQERRKEMESYRPCPSACVDFASFPLFFSKLWPRFIVTLLSLFAVAWLHIHSMGEKTESQREAVVSSLFVLTMDSSSCWSLEEEQGHAVGLLSLSLCLLSLPDVLSLGSALPWS